ncbi:N-acetyltransferase 10, partial [Ophiophagus hannah]
MGAGGTPLLLIAERRRAALDLVKRKEPSCYLKKSSVIYVLPSKRLDLAVRRALRPFVNIQALVAKRLNSSYSKLDDYQDRMNRGERLNQDQLDAVSKHQEVSNNLEFAKELQRSFMALSQDIQKTIKKTARREQLMREEAEQKRLKTVLELQYILDKLGDDEVRSDLKQGTNGISILTEAELSTLDEFYKLVEPERDMNIRLNEQYEQASIHLWDLLEGKEKPICGTTYKALKEIVERILQTSYFDSTHNHQNGLCEEEETASAPAVEDSVTEAEPEPTEEYTEPSEVESTEYVNRQFMAEAQFSNNEKEQVDEWTVETVEVVNSLQQPQATSPPVPDAHTLTTVAQADPLIRRQRVQDLMAQMQGPYNFMQDSMLEFENQALDPAIVSAQPMNPQTLQIPQMVCPPVHAESRLAQTTQVPVQPEATQASITLSTDQTPTSSPLPAASQPQVFQAASSKPLHSSGINVNAAPFQSMQTVFNMNAPVPPVNEPETLKQQNQYQTGYNQTFSNQPHPVEQSELQQEQQLQTVVGTYHGSPDQSHQVAGNHQQPPQQNTGFPRNGQPYYNSRGVSRGGSRGTRGLMNGYRGPANGFRGGYDGYRPSFANTPNSGYTQAQFNAPRDYPNYQRDGYQQNFKRGSGQSGPRGAPRGRGGPPRPNRGMPQMNAQQEVHSKGIIFIAHKDKTTVVSFILPGYGKKCRLRCMFCPKRTVNEKDLNGKYLDDKLKQNHSTVTAWRKSKYERKLPCFWWKSYRSDYDKYYISFLIMGNQELSLKMQRKKVDNRIRIQIENGVAERHRTLFVIVGDRGKDQVVILHHMLSKAAVKARPTVLWCYKKELGFSSHRKKRMRQLQKKIKSGMLDLKQDDPFELFIAATNIRYCYYNETHKILGNTFGMCDFEALTPNLLARTIETVEGGGIIAILLRTMNSLKQLYTMTMDVHSRYRTEAHQDVVGRFNERFILSLVSCKTCVVVDDQLNILPISSHAANISALPPRSQAKGVLKFIEAISEKTLRSTVALTAARGRGKSAALGLAIAGAVAFGYSNIFEHLDYEIIQSLNPEFSKAVVRVNVFREHRQTIQYIHPADAVKLGQAELVVIDEAAAIPLPLVKNLLGPYLVFMASTINGYEGTGRSLSLKLIQQLRQESAQAQASLTAENKTTTTAKLSSARTLHEVSLQESIRYAPGDPVEKWLNDLLCLDCLNITRIISGCPLPETSSEIFLQRLMALYVASHYKNSPNDLQMLSDAPAHHLFCLLPPVPPSQNSLPEVLAVVQVCLEGEISRQSIMNSLSRGKKASGDLIPWNISEQFQDPDFGSLSGGRIVRIAVHPDYQAMGYGSRALRLLQMYYEGKFPCLEEKVIQKPREIATVSSEAVSLLEEAVMPRKDLPPLLLKLSERQAENLDYLGVSYGLTPRLLKFWKRALSRNELEAVFIPYDLKRLEMYSRNMVDYHLIMDMIPIISRMYFLNKFGDMPLSATQAALLLGIGLQHKSMDQLEKEIGLPSSQLMGLFNRTIRKVVQLFNSVQEKAVEEQMAVMKEVVMEPTLKTLNEDLEEAAKEFQEKHKNEIGKLKDLDLSQYIIRGDDEEWNEKRKAEVTTGPRQEKKFKKKNLKLKLKK